MKIKPGDQGPNGTVTRIVEDPDTGQPLEIAERTAEGNELRTYFVPESNPDREPDHPEIRQ